MRSLTECGLGATCPTEVALPLRVLKKLQAALLGCTAHHNVAPEQLAPTVPSLKQHSYRQVVHFAAQYTR